MSGVHPSLEFLIQLFPSFAQLPPESREQRAEGLGRYVAQTWAAGAAGLQQRGIEVPEAVHASLKGSAPGARATPAGGRDFLVSLRQALGDDPHFARVMNTYAKVYADSLRGSGSGSAAVAAADEPSSSRLEDDDDAPLELGDEPDPAASVASPNSPPQPAADDGPLDFADDPDLAPSGFSLGQGARASISSASEIRVESTGGDGGLDLADDDDAPRVAAPVMATGQVVIAPSSDGAGDLDLADADEPEAEARPSLEELLYSGEQAAPPPAPTEPVAKEPSSLTLREKLEGKKRPPKPPASRPLRGVGKAASSGGKDPVDRAILHFHRTGDVAGLKTAWRLLEAQFQQAPHDAAAALAAATMAKIALLEGDVATANRQAKIAQSKDPGNPIAVEVLVRLGRGEAQRSEFLRQLAEVRYAIDERVFDRAKPLVETFKAVHDSLPQPFLCAAFVARIGDDDAVFEANLADAWKRYPPREDGHFPLGGSLDADVVDMLVNYGRAVFRDTGGDRLRQTVENIDHKENLIAGALRMGVAVGRVAIASGGLSQDDERRITFAIGRGLIGLRSYDAALPWLGKASCLGPTAAEAKAISDERINAGALRRAFDRPGIKAQLKAYRCLGRELLTRHKQGHLETIARDRSTQEDQLHGQGTRLATVAKKDLRVQKELENAAGLASVTDPLGPVIAAEEELHEVARERAMALAEDKRKGSESSGLFAKIKGAASKVSGAARDTKLKYKEGQAQTKHREAVKRLTATITRSLATHPWTQIAIKEFVRRANVAEAFFDYLDSEEKRVKEELANFLADDS